MLMKERSRETNGVDLLLEGCPLPHYRIIMQYIDDLQYTSIPDYGYIYFLLKHIAKVQTKCSNSSCSDQMLQNNFPHW